MLLTGMILVVFYPKVIFHPQSYLLADGGDALKNYYCFLWHVHHDSSLVNYSGSNYPFGEHHGYTDGNPLLSGLLRLLPVLTPWAVGIYHVSVFLSFLICALLVFRILKLMGVRDVYAVTAAVGITVLCPQSLRLPGHFTLSYAFCLPLTIYLILKQEQSFQKKYRIWLPVTLFLWFFIHPYLGLICSALTLLFHLFALFASRQVSRKQRTILAFQAIIPLSCYYLFMLFTDHHSDRVAVPFGFSWFRASPETVFVASHPPFRHLLSQLIPIHRQIHEGLAYIGILSVAALPVLLAIILLRRKAVIRHITGDPLRLNFFLLNLAAGCLLLFAMGWPFCLGLEWLQDYAGPLRQFRSPARFAWPFYFCITIGVSALVANHLLKRQAPALKLTVTTGLLLLFCLEGLPYHHRQAKTMQVKNPFLSAQSDPELDSLIRIARQKSFSALLPLPLVHSGSDYYDLPGNSQTTRAAQICAFHTGIPLMAGLTGRSSLTEAAKIIQLVGDPLIPRDIGPDLPVNGHFLMLACPGSISAEEEFLVAKGKLLVKTSHFELREITTEQLVSNTPVSINTPDSSVWFRYNSLHALPGGCFTGNAKRNNRLFSILPGRLLKDSLYTLSFWYRSERNLDLESTVSVRQDSASAKNRILASVNVKTVPHIKNGCLLVKLNFRCTNSKSKIDVEIDGNSDREQLFFIDRLLLRLTNSTICNVDENGRVNNVNTIDL